MRLSEVFLRLASALVAWMVIYAYFIWLAALGKMSCGPDGDEIYRLLLGMIPFAVGGSFLLRVTRAFSEIHLILRWLAVPLAILLPFALKNLWAVLQRVNVEKNPICGDGVVASWQVYWAPLQFLAITVCVWMIFRVWRSLPGGTN